MIELSRGDLALLLLVVWMLALGAGAVLMGVLRPRAAARALVLFGLFSVLHGLRLAANLPAGATIPGLPAHALNQLRFDLTYVVLLPLMLLVEQFVGGGWRGTMRAAVWLQAAYSAAGIAVDGLTGVPGAMMIVKPYFVVVIGAAALGNILFATRHRTDIPLMLSVGFIAFLGTVGVFNFGQIVQWRVSARIETLGFIALVACLAYAVAVRTLDTEARLVAIDREIESARRIQSSILPQTLPSLPGLAVAARYRPMATMAGDFYDFVAIDGRRLGILVADVLGHGVPASLIASMVKVALNAEAQHADDPGRVLSGMNAALVGLLSRDRDFVTSSYVVVDAATTTVRYSRAGHPPPLVRSPRGEVSALDEGGTILGQFANASYENHQRQLEPGGRLLLYTDGVTDAASPAGDVFGVDRLAALLAARRTDGAEQFADAVLETLSAWRGSGRFDDDVTIVVVDLAPAALAI